MRLMDAQLGGEGQRTGRLRISLRASLMVSLLAAMLTLPAPVAAANCAGSSTGNVAIPDLGTRMFQGHRGGLYPDGSNQPPAGYAAAGIKAARAIVPRAPDGRPDANGKIVLLSVGMSNTSIEYSAFIALAKQDRRLASSVLLVNGAQGGKDAKAWVDRAAPAWAFVERELTAAGVTDAQVQAVWLKQAQARPTSGFDNHIQRLSKQIETINRDAAARFPNLQQVFLSPRTYAGYATSPLNPEPYAYQTGFADRLVVAQSIAQPQVRPWVAWGPYLWTDGTKGRKDGLIWTCDDVSPSDGTHPSRSGAQKVATSLDQFFVNSQFTRWFRSGDSTPGAAALARPTPPTWPLAVGGALLLAVAGALGTMLWRRRRRAKALTQP